MNRYAKLINSGGQPWKECVLYEKSVGFKIQISHLVVTINRYFRQLLDHFAHSLVASFHIYLKKLVG